MNAFDSNTWYMQGNCFFHGAAASIRNYVDGNEAAISRYLVTGITKGMRSGTVTVLRDGGTLDWAHNTPIAVTFDGQFVYEAEATEPLHVGNLEKARHYGDMARSAGVPVTETPDAAKKLVAAISKFEANASELIENIGNTPVRAGDKTYTRDGSFWVSEPGKAMRTTTKGYALLDVIKRLAA